MEINRVVYKNHRIIESKNESTKYISTFAVLDGSGKCLIKLKSKNSNITLKSCKMFIDKS